MELKPCPFCGNPGVEVWDEEDYWFVNCEGCETNGPASFGKQAAIQKWNCRSTEDWNKVQSEIEIKMGQEK